MEWKVPLSLSIAGSLFGKEAAPLRAPLPHPGARVWDELIPPFLTRLACLESSMRPLPSLPYHAVFVKYVISSLPLLN